MPENAVGAVPVIEGSQIFLHPLRMKDIPRLNHWRNDLTTREQLVLHPYPIPLEQDMLWFKERIAVANNRQIYFGVSLKDTHELAGYANIININWIHRTCNVGALIRKSQHKHQALGLETAVLVMEYVFKTLGLERICVHVIADNKRALMFNRMLGYRKEALMRKHVFMNGAYHDICVLGILRNEYLDARDQLRHTAGLSR